MSRKAWCTAKDAAGFVPIFTFFTRPLTELRRLAVYDETALTVAQGGWWNSVAFAQVIPSILERDSNFTHIVGDFHVYFFSSRIKDFLSFDRKLTRYSNYYIIFGLGFDKCT